jgi:hypothetical protein
MMIIDVLWAAFWLSMGYGLGYHKGSSKILLDWRESTRSLLAKMEAVQTEPTD